MAWAAQELPTHFRYILGKLNDQRQHEHFTDITLIVSGQQFRAHRAVLAASSNFFHTFFQDFHNEPLVEIEGVSVEAFRQLLEFTYTASFAIEGSNPASLGSVLKAAKYLQMEEAIRTLVARQKVIRQTSGKKKLGEHRKIFDARSVVTEPLPEMTRPEKRPQQANAPKQATEVGGGGEGGSALALLADITSKYEQEQPTGDSQCPAMELELTDDGLEGALVERGGVEVEVSSTSDAPPPPVTPERLFCCKYCSRSFRMYYHFREHLRTHAGPKFTCKDCGKKYTRERAWKLHVACHHRVDDDEASGQNSNLIHTCIYCNKTFRHQGHFKEHLRKHTGEKPFECPNCPKQFGRKGTLKTHLQACSSSFGAKKGRRKVYECQICTRSFQHWERFKEHLTEHTGDRPNHCVTCDHWFTRPDELQKHMSDVHGAGPVAGELHTLNIVTVDMPMADVQVQHVDDASDPNEQKPESHSQQVDPSAARVTTPQAQYVSVLQAEEAATAQTQYVSVQQTEEAATAGHAEYVSVQQTEEAATAHAQYVSVQHGEEVPAHTQYVSVQHGEEASAHAQYVTVQHGEEAPAHTQYVTVQHGEEASAHTQYVTVQHEEEAPEHTQYVSVQHAEEAPEHTQYVSVQHGEEAPAHTQYVSVQHGEEAPAHTQYVSVQHGEETPAHTQYVSVQHGEEAPAHTQYVSVQHGEEVPAHTQYVSVQHGEDIPAVDSQDIDVHTDAQNIEKSTQETLYVDASVGTFAEAAASETQHMGLSVQDTQHMHAQHLDMQQVYTHMNIGLSESQHMDISTMETQHVDIQQAETQHIDIQQVDTSAPDTHVYILIPNTQHIQSAADAQHMTIQHMNIPMEDTQYVNIATTAGDRMVIQHTSLRNAQPMDIVTAASQHLDTEHMNMSGTEYVEIPTSEMQYMQIPNTDADTHYVQIPTMEAQYVEVPTTHAQYVDAQTSDSLAEDTQVLSEHLETSHGGIPQLAAYQPDTEGNIAAFAIAPLHAATHAASCAPCPAGSHACAADSHNGRQ